MMGSSTPAGTALPPAAGTSALTASYLAYQDLTGALGSPGTATIQVCSASLGVNPDKTAKCETCTNSGSCTAVGATGSPAPDPDPEPSSFVLNRVDVTYKFIPLIPGTPFGLALLPLSACTSANGSVTCTFHRQVSMRAMGN
jgi:hypothetical protein